MTSQPTSNTLLDDPSIIQVVKEDDFNDDNSSPMSTPTASSGSIEPGSALSKLLDSAIAKAAEESTPELEPRSSSSSPHIRSSPTKPISSKKNFDRVYTIEVLLELKNLPFVKDYKETNELPDKGFWRSKSKSQNNSSGSKEFGHTSKHGNNNTNNKNKTSFNKKRQDSASHWERKAGFLKTGDLDALSEDKISQLLGEPVEEIEPEWENADLNDELNLNMGQTVEDFEKWKSNMRSEERRKNGEVIEESSDVNAEKSGNEVDYFFSFVKPKKKSFDSTSLKAPSSGVSTPTVANSEQSAKSSRFSSFFNTPSSEIHPRADQSQPHSQAQHQLQAQHQTQVQQQMHAQQQMQARGQPQMPQSHQLPVKGDQGYSRFLSMMGHPNESSRPSPQLMSPHKESRKDAKIPIPGQPLNNDSFFMSLLKKTEGPDGSNPSSPALFNATQTQPNAKISSPDTKQSPLTPNIQPQIQPQMQLQRMPAPKQPMNLPPGQQLNQQQLLPQQMPPWMRQFQGGPNGPNDPRSPGAGPGAHPAGSNGTNPPPPPPPHLQYAPNMGHPPPKMFPPGFMPHPGMPIPSQFANGRNGPMPPPGNHPYMAFPPGMPPPPGMGMPPLQQSNGFDQRNQPSARR